MYDGEGALENRSRKLIYNYIKTHPGVSFKSIKMIFDMKNSTLEYHLHYLEKDNKITSRRDGRLRCYFCKHRVLNLDESRSLSGNINNLTNIQKQLLDQIKRYPGISKKELGMRNRINKKKLSYHIKRLGDLDLIWMVKSNGVAGYEYISKEKLRNEIYKRLIAKLLLDEFDEETYIKIKKKLDKLDIDNIEI